MKLRPVFFLIISSMHGCQNIWLSAVQFAIFLFENYVQGLNVGRRFHVGFDPTMQG